MKRFIKLCAFPLMASAMTGCTSNEDIAVPQKADNAIGFKIVSQNMTRAANSYCNAVTPNKIKVTAYDTEDNSNYYKGNIDVLTKPADGRLEWNYPDGQERYWPEGKAADWEGLLFYAFVDDNDEAYSDANVENGTGTFMKPGDDNYASTVATLTTEETSNAITTPIFHNFTVNNDVKLQKDLLYAVNKAKPKTAKNGQVDLNFRHALSQICFTGKNNNPMIDDIEILSVEIGGKDLMGAGTYVLPDNTTAYGPNDHIDFSKEDDVPNYSEVGNIGYWTNFQNSDSKYKIDVTKEVSDGESAVKKGVSLGSFDPKGYSVSISRPLHTNYGWGDKTTDPSDLECQYAMNLIPQFASDGTYLKVAIKKTIEGIVREQEEVNIPIASID